MGKWTTLHKTGKSLEVIGIAKDFPNRTPVAQDITAKTNKWDYTLLAH